MNEFELKGTTPDGKPASVWACGACMRSCVDETHAKVCCDPRCSGCGEPAERGWTICRNCQEKKQAKRDREIFDRATKVPISEYKHEFVYFDHKEDFVEVDWWMDMDPDERPGWAFACVDQPVPHLDAVDILGGPLEDYYEGAIEKLDVEALQQALDAWRATQTLTAYTADFKTIVVLDAHKETSCEE